MPPVAGTFFVGGVVVPERTVRQGEPLRTFVRSFGWVAEDRQDNEKMGQWDYGMSFFCALWVDVGSCR